MSRSLPPEILDLIVDDLHYQSEALETCCIVSKSWIPRARKHLFAHVKFYASRSHVELWKKAFPDPSTSPAHHTRSLLICGIPVITAADAGVGGWICTFRNVVHLCFDHIYAAGRLVSLVPFYGLSPTVRSLNLNSVPDDLFGLICSFPLLEDLTMLCYPTLEANGWNSPTTLPKLTGSLHLRTGFEIRSAIHWFCALPGGLHFTKITVLFSFEDAESIVDLVSKCSDTLESLSVAFLVLSETSRTPCLDLSKATKLKDLKLQWERLSVQWIITTLETVEPCKSLEHITILPTTDDAGYQEWRGLDHLLVQFWITYSIRPRIVYGAGRGGRKDHISSLLPELTGRGLADFEAALYSW